MVSMVIYSISTWCTCDVHNLLLLILAGCRTGEAKMTSGYGLPAR